MTPQCKEDRVPSQIELASKPGSATLDNLFNNMGPHVACLENSNNDSLQGWYRDAKQASWYS